MAMQGFAPQGPDALTLLMQAQQQKQDSNPLASIAMTAAPFILKGLGGKPPVALPQGGGMTPASAPIMQGLAPTMPDYPAFSKWLQQGGGR